MLQFSKWQIALIGLLVALGAYFLAPNFFPEGKTPVGLPESRITLGLDLQGGSYLLLEADTDEVLQNRLKTTQENVRTALRGTDDTAKKRIQFANLNIKNDQISVRIRKAEDVAEAKSRLDELAKPVGVVIGGANARPIEVTQGKNQDFTIIQTEAYKAQVADEVVRDSIEVVRRRIDELGTREPIIQRQGPKRLIVKVPGESDPEALKAIINRTGQLTFHPVDETVSAAEAQAGLLPPRRILLPSTDGSGPLVLVEAPTITGDMVIEASATPNADGGGYQVNFGFDKNGTLRFRKFTQENIGRRFAIVLDDRIISAPNIISPIIGGSGRITGRFTPQEATELAVLIRAGALPAPLLTIEQRTVGAELGKDSVTAGTRAFIIGLIGVFIYMIITYGRFGIYADLALMANMILLFGLLSVLGATLTLPGIAGIVLTIGMAVDANVLIFERIREEAKSGKGSVAAVETGYKRAWSAILDANITTFLAAAIMFYLGAGPVKGFSVTLAIGVITSVFTAYVVTRLFAGGYVLKHRPKDLKL